MPVTVATRETQKVAPRAVNEFSDALQEVESDVFEADVFDRAAYQAQAAHHAPGKEHHAHYRGSLEAAPKARSRFVGAHRHVPARETVGVVNGTSTLSPLDEDVLIFHEVTQAARQPAPLVMDEVVAEAARRRRRARAPHRAFRLTGTQMMAGGLLLAQLLMVLWLQGQSLALRNKDYKLRREIAQTRELIAQKKNQISQLDSEVHLSQLAAQLHWDKAPMTSFDKINDTHRLTPEEAEALMAKPANGNLIAQAN